MRRWRREAERRSREVLPGDAVRALPSAVERHGPGVVVREPSPVMREPRPTATEPTRTEPTRTEPTRTEPTRRQPPPTEPSAARGTPGGRHARPRQERARGPRPARRRFRLLGLGGLVVALLVGLVAAGVALVPMFGFGSDSGKRDPFGAGGVLPSAPPGMSVGSGFYQVEKGRDGRWLFRTPDGRPFYSVGVNEVRMAEDTERGTGRCPYCETVATRFPDPRAWVDSTAGRLETWGFNTLGTGSESDLFGARFAYTQQLDLNADPPPGAAAWDWFDPAFEVHVAQVARDKARPRASDPNLLGWFLDDELRWGPDGVTSRTLLDDYLALPEGTPGRTAAEARRGDPQGFLLDAATRYFEVTTRVVRAVDPNHLILGVRAASHTTPAVVVNVAGKWVDVFSVKAYRLTPEGEAQIAQATADAAVVPMTPDLRPFHELSGRPVMVAEFSWRAADAGAANTVPAGLPVEATQQVRGERYGEAVGPLFSAPWMVGHHWHRYVDSPPAGRASPDDGQDSNLGLVSVGDVPWEPLVSSMAAANAWTPGRS